MSESTNSQATNGGFAKAFLPGLIIGLVVGAVGGAFLAPIIAESSGPQAQIERSKAEAAKFPAQPAPVEQATEAAKESAEKVVEETKKAVEKGVDEVKKEGEKAVEAIKPAPTSTPAPTTPKPDAPK